MTFEWGRRSAGTALMAPVSLTRRLSKSQKSGHPLTSAPPFSVPFGVTYEKIGTIQRRLAWPLHKDDTLSRSGRPTGLNIYASRSYNFCSNTLLARISVSRERFIVNRRKARPNQSTTNGSMRISIHYYMGTKTFVRYARMVHPIATNSGGKRPTEQEMFPPR